MSRWERIARFYDRQLWLERAALNAAIDLAGITAESRLLDLGTGTGALLGQLAKRRVELGGAVGVDGSAAMLARAPALPEHFRLLVADASALPLPSRSFDVVTAAYLLHLLDRSGRTAVLAEARRVMRPGARLVLVTVAAPRSRTVRRALAPAARIARRGSATLLGLRPLDPRPDLEREGFLVRRTLRIARGYPSMVVIAERREARLDATS